MLGWQMAYVIPAVIQHFQSPQASFNLCNQLFLFEKSQAYFLRNFSTEINKLELLLF